MTLNHLNLSVTDVPSVRSFFEKYFGFVCTDSKLNDTLSVLSGTDGFILVIMDQRMNEKGNNSYPDAFHIGFYLPDEAAVKDIYQSLQQGGIILQQAPQPIRKTYGFYFHYNTIMIEVACTIKD